MNSNTKKKKSKFELNKHRLIQLREQGLGNKRLAKELGVSTSTIVLWLRRVGMDSRLKEYQPTTYRNNNKIECLNCGIEYLSRYKTTKFCSDSCRGKHNKRTRGYNKIHQGTRAKRIRRNGSVDYGITVRSLVERDESICWICENKVDENDFKRDNRGYITVGDYYPSIDHVIPISKGGTHTWDNVKLAHKICNAYKGDNTTLEDRQLTLL